MVSARIVSVLLALFALGPRAAFAGPSLHGQVVDAETGEPLGGSIVVVVWRKTAWYNMDGGGAVVQKVVEKLADAEGRFSVEDDPGWNLNPFTYRDPDPSIGIFHVGYAPFPVAEESVRIKRADGSVGGMDRAEQAAALRAGMIVRLPRLTSSEQFARYSTRGYVVMGDAPPHLIPHLMEALNQHRIAAGLEPLLSRGRR